MFHAEERFVPFEKKIWLSSPTMHGPELEYIKDAYEKNWMSTVGENINEVERLACETVGCKYAVALATGTSALHLAVKLAGVKPGEKVFCSDMTFSATVNPVVYEGGVRCSLTPNTTPGTWIQWPWKRPLNYIRRSGSLLWPIYTGRRERSMSCGLSANAMGP